VGELGKKRATIKSDMYADEGDYDMTRTRHYSKLNNFLKKMWKQNKYLQTTLAFPEDFLKTCVNICSRKLLVMAKESKHIQPGNAELTGNGVKRANLFCVVPLHKCECF
jgi:hypothetical protein